jgi:hypothetical protein
MNAPGNGILLTLLMIVFTVSTGYASGRVHQWYRASMERDQAYREGYDTATRSLFSVAARLMRPRRGEKGVVRGTATVSPIRAAPRAVSGTAWGVAVDAARGSADPRNALTVVAAGGRHKVSDELVHGPTYPEGPDHLARTKVPSTVRQATRPWASRYRHPGDLDGTSRRPAGEAAHSGR